MFVLWFIFLCLEKYDRTNSTRFIPRKLLMFIFINCISRILKSKLKLMCLQVNDYGFPYCCTCIL